MKRTLAACVLALLPAATHAETLVLYTSQPNSDAQKTVDAFEKAYPDIHVQWVRDGTTKMMAKLDAEFAAGNPQPDVLLIADTVTMQRLKQQGRLLDYLSPERTKFDPALYDKDGAYYSTKLITTGIMYNTAAKMKPTSWHDLTKPAAKGLVAMPSPLTSGAALINTATLVNTKGFGWKFFHELAANGVKAAGGNGGVFKAVASGEKAYGVVVDFLPIRAARKGAPVAFVFPKEGVTAVTEPVAILKTAKHVDAAKKFVDFELSTRGQDLISKMGYIPGRKGIPMPPGYPPRADIKVLSVNPAVVLTKGEAYKKEFAKIFQGGM